MPAKRPDTTTKYDAFSTGSALRKQNQDVRVGYIDPERGYVDGLTVYQANKYAEANPGTQFIHKNRDRVAYININTVNKLTNTNIKPKQDYRLTDDEGNYTGCNTVKGLITSPDGTELPNQPGEGSSPFTPEPSSGTGETGTGSEIAYGIRGTEVDPNEKQDPIIIIEGGGGVGAIGKAIIGEDGSLLHVRVVHGGFGYRFPPRVRVFDPNQKGAGATAKSFTGRTTRTSDQPIRFDQESDAEDYDFNLPPLGFDPSTVPFGQSYSLKSNTVVGDWDPRKVLSVTQATGFEQELRKYLDFLAGFDPNKPWWTTRNEEPVKVVGEGRERVAKKAGNILFPVEHPAWGGEKNISKDLVSVEFEVYGQGTRGNRSIYYEFTAQDGSHKFRIKGVTHEARNEKTRTDVVKVKANTTYDVKASVISGRGARSEKVEQGLLEKAGRGAAENRKFQEEQRSSTIFGDIIGSLNDNDDIQITAKRGKFKASNRRAISVDASDAQKEKFKSQPNRFRRATFDLTYRVNVPGATTVTRTISPSFMNNNAICPTLPSHKEGSDMHGNLYTMIWKEQFPYDGQYTFRGICDDKANVYLDGEKIMVLPGHKGTDQNFAPKMHKMQVDEGLHEIKIDLINKTFKKIIKKQITSKGGKTKGRIPVDFEVYGQGSPKNTSLRVIFTALNGTDTFTIRPKKDFVKGKYKYTKTVKILPNTDYKVNSINVESDSFTAGGGTTEIPIILAAPGTKGRGKRARIGNVERKKITYLDERGDDPNAQLSIDSTSPGLTAKFSGDGSKLITKGRGFVTLKFKWDDNPRSAGLAVGELTVKNKTFRQRGEKGTQRETIKIGNSTSGNPESETTIVYPIDFTGLNSKNNPINVSKNREKLLLKDGSGSDTNAEIIIEDVKGGTAKFTQDGRGIEVKGNCSIRISLEWDDNPNTAGVALNKFQIGGKVWAQRGRKGVKTQTINLKGAVTAPPEESKIQLVPEQGTLRSKAFTSGGKGIEGGSKPSTVMFADTIGSLNDNDDMQIRCGQGLFIPSNKRSIKGRTRKRTETRGTWDLTYRLQIDSPNDPRLDSISRQLKRGGFATDSDIQEVTVFNTNEYINRANRKLFKVYPCADEKKTFFTQNAVTPFNPLELDKDFPKITKPRPEKPRKPQVNFERDGKNLKLKVTGSGKVKIGFRLKTDDNFRTSGVFAEEIRISADGPDVRLKRTKTKKYTAFHPDGRSRGRIGRQQTGTEIKEKEKIDGEGVFTAGREYNVKIIGGSRTSGFKTVDKTKVYFDDDINNKFDENGELRIKYINVIEEKKDLGPLPNGAANKIPSTRYTGDTNDYAGTHIIRWNNVRFPVTGNYKIGVMVDDNVRIEIGTKQRGNVVNIYKKGFTAPGRSSGKSEYIENIPEGNYTITAYLQQIPGRPINDGNPMGLAINIDTVFAEVEEEVIINKSWYQNPYGAALTIHAPLPPVPTENITQEKSQCPKNPIWTTRFNQADGEDRWIPVNHRDASGRRTWSRFMNSYALSPILPLGTPSSGQGGTTWETKWDLDIPYDGYYNFKGAVDNEATVSIGTHVIKKLDHFGTAKKDLTDNKIFLRKGKVEISASVFNEETRQPVLVEKKCFNSADWASKPKDKPDKVGVDFDVYGHGSIKNMGLKFVFQEKGGSDTFTIDNVTESRKTDTVRKRVKRNTDYKVTAIATGTHTIKNKEKRYRIELAAPGTKGRGRRARIGDVERKKIRYLDERGDDPNATLSIDSMSPGQTAKFSDDGSELIVKGNGEVTLKFKWDDNPRSAGLAVGELKVADKTFRQRGEKGEERQTIRIGGGTSKGATRKNIAKNFSIDYNGLNSANRPINVSSNGRRIKLKDGGGSDTNAEIIIEDVKGGTAKFSSDGRSIEAKGTCSIRITLEWDDNPGDNGVALDSFSIGGKVWTRRGRKGDKTQTITLDATQFVPAPPEEVKLVPEQGTLRRGSFGSSRAGGAKESPNQTDVIFADVIGSANDNDDMQVRCSRGIFTPSNKRKGIKGTSGQGTQRRNTWDLTFRVDAAEEQATTITELNGVNYVGPELASYRRGKLGRLISPFFPLGEDQGGDLLNGRTWEMVWENVDFPISGNYDFQFEVDDVITVSVSNEESKSKNITYKEISKTTLKQVRENGNNPVLKKARIEKGKRNVKVVLENASLNRTFRTNPTYFGMKIKFRDFVLDADRRSWLTNPVGISAVLLAPPCPRDSGGVGIVTAITVSQPGNGYKTKPPGDSDYVNVRVEIEGIDIDTPGIGYTPGDQAIINGRSFPLEVGEFGKVVGIGITPIAITSYPEIAISTRTGTNVVPVPRTRLVVDPIDDQDVIQITDLAGLKQTGYIQGRAYYGEVYYENGIPFAGRYKTAGTPIQVYATLQESIDGEVTTRPSAIQRSGTDVNSNDPRLNIPGTPDNLV